VAAVSDGGDGGDVGPVDRPRITPVYRPPRRRRDRTRLAVGASIAGVVVAALLTWLVVNLAARQPDKVNLGDDTFVVGRAARLAARIDEERAPFLFKDPLTSRPGREVYVQHVGRDDEQGWLAIEAYAPGSPRELRCILRWDAGRRVFTDPCAGGAAYPADGRGLRTYPATVRKDGQVEVNLRTAP
jgi:hypothetical protein